MKTQNQIEEKLCICGHTESEAHIFIGQPEADSQCIGNGGNCKCVKFVEQTQEVLQAALTLTERQRNAFRSQLEELGYTDADLLELVATETDYDYKHDWQMSLKFENAYVCAACGEWTSNLPAYKFYTCPAKDRRKIDRRQN